MNIRLGALEVIGPKSYDEYLVNFIPSHRFVEMLNKVHNDTQTDEKCKSPET